MSEILKCLARLRRDHFSQVLIVTLGVIFLSAAGEFFFESFRPDSNIDSFWDSLWWAIVTMTTVGYGDKYPVSLGGRVVGIILICSGVGLMSLDDGNKLRRVDIPRQFIGGTFAALAHYYREKHQAILIGLLQEKKTVKLDDLLADDSSAIDVFIREKLKESKKEFFREKEETRAMINPEDGYVISGDDFAVLLSRSVPPNEEAGRKRMLGGAK